MKVTVVSAKPHALAYSFIGIQTLFLATNFPSIYWNCSCLIVNAGGAELLDADDVEEDDVSDETAEAAKKKKNKSVNYGKISKAIGESKAKGIKVLPPDINKSDLIFKPDLSNNAIIYGMKGISRIGTQLVYNIFNNRPYNNIEDFTSKVKVNVLQMVALIKAGTFDNLYELSREQIMENYIKSITDTKQRLTLQNMQMLIAKDLIPKELEFQVRVFNFNKYLKNFKSDTYYKLDTRAMKFLTENYDENLIECVEVNNNEQSGLIKQKVWDNLYKKEMNPVRDWIKENSSTLLEKLNNSLLKENLEKYADGNVSKWEMDSLGFYYHDHELQNLKAAAYDLCDFNSLPEQPEIERKFVATSGQEIKLFKLSRIAGTVIDKDKNKGTVTLLTTTSVVTVKVWKNQFASWDKQIFKRDFNGVKHIIEKSWFQRGTKLIVTGVRRGDDFVPKKYKNTPYPLFERIIELDDEGKYIKKSATERAEGDN